MSAEVENSGELPKNAGERVVEELMLKIDMRQLALYFDRRQFTVGC